jgi:hypothetical protein
MDEPAWIEGVFRAVGQRVGAPVRGSGTERAIGKYRIAHDDVRPDIGDVPWYVAIVGRKSTSRSWLVDAFDPLVATPERVADEILRMIKKLEDG